MMLADIPSYIEILEKKLSRWQKEYELRKQGMCKSAMSARDIRFLERQIKRLKVVATNASLAAMEVEHDISEHTKGW